MIDNEVKGRRPVGKRLRGAALVLALACQMGQAVAQSGAVFDPVAPRRGPLPTRLPAPGAPPPSASRAPIAPTPKAPVPMAPAPRPAALRPTPPAAFAAPPPPAAVTPGPVDVLSLPLRADQSMLLARTLQDATLHGFGPNDFAVPPIGTILSDPDPLARLVAQRQLVSATLAYARAMRSGRLTPGAFPADWGLRPAAYDAASEMAAALQQNRLNAWLADLAPPYVGYESLQQGLAAYRAIEDRGGWSPVPAGPVLKVGLSDPRVPALRARLAAEDPTTPQGPSRSAAPGADLVFDQGLSDAVARAQRRFGLEPSGQVGGPTLAALNTPIDTRIGQIVANMERWRWLPREMPADRIQVNIAAAVLTVFSGDAPVSSMRAVTGRPGDETPMLASVIDNIVLNPPWNVPAGIAAKELWPKGQAYLDKNNFVSIPTGGGNFRLQQKPGPDSALGRVKFDFPNPYAVYLHDTPAQARFESFSRLASHGCVRLQKPVELAKAVLAGDPVWTPQAIDATIAAGKTVRVPLARPISVYLLYWTAYMGVDGQMNFRGDPYGWDALLLQRIAAGGPGPA